jgi:hypothetical protein
MTDTIPSATEYEPEDLEVPEDGEGDEVTVPSPAEPTEAAGDPAI